MIYLMTEEAENISKCRLIILLVIAGILYLVIAKPLATLRLLNVHAVSWSWLHETISGVLYCGFVFFIFYFFAGIRVAEFGFKFSTYKKGVRYWLLSVTIFCSIVIVLYLLATNIISMLGYKFVLYIPSSSDVPVKFLFSAFVWSPVFEEIVFRGVLLGTLSMIIGRRPIIIVIGGTIFSVIHFYYGNPDPMNFVAGYFLCWVFYQTQSLLLPCIFHFFGNIFCYSLSVIESYYPGFLNQIVSSLIL